MNAKVKQEPGFVKQEFDFDFTQPDEAKRSVFNKRKKTRNEKTVPDKKQKKGARPVTDQDLPPEVGVDLTDEQSRVLEAVRKGENVLICGSAGSGKSLLIKAAVRMMQKEGKNVYVTASTGAATCNLDIGSASTLHSFFSAGLCEEKAEKIYEGYLKQGRNSKGLANFSTVDSLVVDEISMVHPDFFSKLDRLARLVRRSPEPFGRIQLVLSGDWAQLPPVTKEKKGEKMIEDFCFETDSWASGKINVFVLSKVFRQDGDPAFVELLESMRKGVVSDLHVKLLRSRLGTELTIPHSIKPTVLYPLNRQVIAENDRMMGMLRGMPYIFKSTSQFLNIAENRGKTILRKMHDNLPFEDEVTLKVGCSVILIANLDIQMKLANGSQGVVTGFTDAAMPIVKFSHGLEIAMCEFVWTYDDREKGVDNEGVEFSGVTVRQIPLRLAFALTIHRSQGLTLDYVKLSLGKEVFASGHAYVGLSRCRNLSGLTITEFSESSIRFNPKVSEFYKKHTLAPPIQEDVDE